jgi:hypothetical protein
VGISETPMKKKKKRPSRAVVAAKAVVIASTAPESEVDAYDYIRGQLRDLGWVVKPPDRHVGGQVWTQNQCFAHPEIKRTLGLMRPENIVCLTETSLWVIEAKSRRVELKTALHEAEHDYARKIEAGGVLRVPVISGVAGNDAEGYEVRTRLLVDGKYMPVTINGVEATGLLDAATIKTLLETGQSNIADFTVNEKVFLRAAESINRTLHTGGINKNDRARVMAALLLALVDSSTLNVDEDLPVLIDDINSRTKSVLTKHAKPEFLPFVRIEPPTSAENHVKFKAAIVRTIQELSNLSIKSAMSSGTDVLGRFYEVFLRYGNGAKEIGIVLTPRHVTRFAVETVGVGPNDFVLDPACGTGGFLVAAFDHVRESAKPEQVNRFKKYSLFGIEQESYVAALAIVNMIFRGDGKNNIVEANCFSKFLHRTTTGNVPTARYDKVPPKKGEEPITRVFMNPPFALKKSDEREWGFVEAALKSMQDGGLLFAIVPMSVVTEGGKAGAWRKPLLDHHTVLAVMSFPEELFYPVSNQTVAVILRRGVPHPAGQPVFWGRIVNDGFRKSKGKRLPAKDSSPNDLVTIKPALRAFLLDPRQPVSGVPEFVCAAPIDMGDPILELAPEAYLDSRLPSTAELVARLDRQVRENVGALVAFDLKGVLPGPQRTIIDDARGAKTSGTPSPITTLPTFRPVPLEDLFTLTAGDYHNLAEEDPGPTPVASCADTENGIAGYYDTPAEHLYRDALTIAFNGSPLTTKMHPYAFGAKDDVAVAIPKSGLPVEALIFIQAQLNAERWRFSYYRKCFRDKLGRTTVELPVGNDGKLDLSFMVRAVRAQPYWWFLAPRLSGWKSTAPIARIRATFKQEPKVYPEGENLDLLAAEEPPTSKYGRNPKNSN